MNLLNPVYTFARDAWDQVNDYLAHATPELAAEPDQEPPGAFFLELAEALISEPESEEILPLANRFYMSPKLNEDTLDMQREEGIQRATLGAIAVITTSRDWEFSEKKLDSDTGIISTCLDNSQEPQVCVGSRIAVSCPKEKYIPMLLNSCVSKFANEALPQLLKEQGEATCFDIRYERTPGKLDMSVCIGHAIPVADSFDIQDMESAYQAVLDGKTESIEGIVNFCDLGDANCDPLTVSYSRYCFKGGAPMPSLNDFLEKYFEPKYQFAEAMEDCSLIAYGFSPDCLELTACTAN